MPSTELTIYNPPKLLTEREVRLAGSTSHRLLSLRGTLRQGVASGTFTVSTSNGTVSLPITSVDTEALIALLIERDEAFLTGLNIELEQ